MSSTPIEMMPKTAATAAPAKASPAPWESLGKRGGRSPRLRWPIVVFIVAAVVVPTSYLLLRRTLHHAPTKDLELFTVAPRSFPVLLDQKGELKAADVIEIRSELEGKATIISLIPEGTHAKKGDLLVELASDQIDENIREATVKEATAIASAEAAKKELEILQDKNASDTRKAEVTLQMAQSALEKYREGEAVELRQDADLALEKARSVLKRASEDFTDAKKLFDQSFVTRIELENYRFKEYEAKLELQKAELAQQVLEKYTIPMALREKGSDVTEAEKELERTKKSATASEAKAKADMTGKQSELNLVQEKLAKLRDQKSKAKIVAPSDGLVVYARNEHWFRSDSQIEKGATVFERQSLIELPDTSKMKVTIRVHEAQMEHLKVGLPATIEVEGVSGKQFTGKVDKIAVLADSQNRWLNPNLKEYSTEVLLEGAGNDLKPGTTAHVKIEMAQLNNVLAVPVQAVFGKAGKYYLFSEHSGKISSLEVQVGLSSNEYVEIKQGLKAGDVVRLAVTDEMKTLLPDTGDKSESGEAKPRRKTVIETAQPAATSQPNASSTGGDTGRSGRSSGGGGSGRRGGGGGRH